MCAWTAWLLLPHKKSQRCFPPLFLETIPWVTWTRLISHTLTTRCSWWRARGSGGWWAAEIADGAALCRRTAWCPAETWSSSGSTSATFTAALWEPHADDEPHKPQIWSQISHKMNEEDCSTLLFLYEQELLIWIRDFILCLSADFKYIIEESWDLT